MSTEPRLARPKPRGIAFLLLFAGLLSVTTALRAEGDEFPGRTLFPTVKWIAIDDLHAQRQNYEIIDVRSNYEYETLHISGAGNIPVGTNTFVEEVKKLRRESDKPIAFYCNGRSCLKSYQAAFDAQKANVSKVYAYDAGIFDWVKKYPEEAVLLGTSPVDPSRLLGKEKLQAHMLPPEQFEKKIGKDAVVLDVRDRFQQAGATLFPLSQRSVALDNKELKKYVDQAIRERKSLLIYDATGQQVRWLQYYLEAEKVPSYYFMEGGAKAYYDDMLEEIMTE